MTLQLLDFCLSVLTLCSSYMEVPTYLNFKAMNHMVSLRRGAAAVSGGVARASRLAPSCLSWGWAGLPTSVEPGGQIFGRVIY